MNEVVLDGVNGICVDSVPWGEAGSGIPAFDPDFDQLTAAIERLGDAAERERLAAGRDRAARGRAQLGPAPSEGLAAALAAADRARRRRHEVVQPRPAGGRPPAALGGRRARARELRPRAAEEGEAARGPGRSTATTSGTSPASPRPRPTTSPREEYLRLGRGATGSRRSSATRTTSSPSSRSFAAAASRTIGRFVWEHFTADHVAGAREAFDVVYSLTRAEQAALPRDGPRDALRPVGLPSGADRGRRGGPAGSEARAGALRLSRRLSRPPQAARAGARGVRGDRATSACGWSSRPRSSASRCAPPRRRPSATSGSSCGSPTSRPPSTCASSRASTSASRPARWEGLGLPLYEAIAFGMPAITNDAPPMNEPIHDGRQRPPGRARRRTEPRSRESRRSTPTSATCATRSSGWPTRRCASGSPQARSRSATPSATGRRPWTGSASCLRHRRESRSLACFMGFSDQIDRYRKRPASSSPTRRLQRPHARAAAGAVRLRRHPLGDDAPAADARLAPRPRDPGRDPLGAEADQGVRALEAVGRRRRDAGDRPQALGRLPPRRRRVARPDHRAHPVTAADSIRAFYMLYAEREGKSRYGDKTPGYMKEMRRIQRVLPEAASSTSSATAATSRSRTCG